MLEENSAVKYYEWIPKTSDANNTFVYEDAFPLSHVLKESSANQSERITKVALVLPSNTGDGTKSLQASGETR